MSGQFMLNGQVQAAAPRPQLLIDVLRAQQRLTGSKAACGEGECGSCQVLVKHPGERVFRSQLSCMLRVQDVSAAHVLTIEALPLPNPLQRVLADAGASQCGYCSPGLVMACVHWLLHGPELSVAEGCRWINGNLCRCTGYMGQRRALSALVDAFAAVLLGSSDRLGELIRLGLLPECAGAVCQPEPGAGEQREQSEHLAAVVSGGPLVAGGTDLYLQQNMATVVGPSLLRARGSGAVRRTDDGYAISARHDLEVIAAELARMNAFTVFASFVRGFASLPIRNRATLGGNLAHASPVADGITLLLAVDARIETDQRRVAIHELYPGYKQTCLRPGEIIEWIHVPSWVDQQHGYFDKVCRRPTTDIAAVNMASSWQVVDNHVLAVSLACGGASAMPLRLTAIERALEGADLDHDIDPAIESVLQSLVTPISDIRGGAEYRRILVRQLLRAHWLALQSDARNWRRLKGNERRAGEGSAH